MAGLVCSKMEETYQKDGHRSSLENGLVQSGRENIRGVRSGLWILKANWRSSDHVEVDELCSIISSGFSCCKIDI